MAWRAGAAGEDEDEDEDEDEYEYEYEDEDEHPTPCAKSNCYPRGDIVVPKGCYPLAFVLG